MTRSKWFNPRQVAKLPPLDPTTAPIKTGHQPRNRRLPAQQERDLERKGRAPSPPRCTVRRGDRPRDDAGAREPDA